jgi:DNA repair photolyase
VDELLGIFVPSPRDDFRIREVTVDHALRPDPLPNVDYSFNPYVGCFHGCVFCYVPRLLQLERSAWGKSVTVKRNAPTVLAREVRRMTKGLVMISTATDPYQFVEGKFRITRHALEVLLRARWPVSILSRSPLMIRDVDLFRQFETIEVGMSVPTLDDRARALLEPWAPAIEARLRCLEALADAGLKPFVSLAPAYPPTEDHTPERIAAEFANRGVAAVFTRTLDARWGVREAMLRRLEGSEIGPQIARISDASYMESFLAEVADSCRSHGLQFRGEGRYKQFEAGPTRRTSTSTAPPFHDI